MMARIILALLAFAMVMAVLKMVIVALVVAGLIFRTKETIGLLMLGGTIALIKTYPAVGLGLLAAAFVAVIVQVRRNKRAPPPLPEDIKRLE
jgi:hypothetical protein